MNNHREKNVMNLSHSRHGSSASQPPLQMHNFMPMPSSSVHVDHDQSEAERRASYVNQLKKNMQSFWRERLSEICDSPTDVRTPHTLPLARIKKVMKSDEKVKMISADTPVLFGKACEIFVMELTLRAWMHTQQNKRKTVQRNDIAYAIRDDTLLAFLNDMVPLESHHQHEADVSMIPNNINYDGVYVPHPLPPNYSMYLQAISNQSEGRGHSVPLDHDHHLAFPMNLPADNFNPAYLGSGGMQQYKRPNFPPPSPSHNGPNPYLTFKEFFQ